MEKHCLSCGQPLIEMVAHGKTDRYCTYCADEEGNLLPYEQVRAGAAAWLQSFAPVTEGVDFQDRAGKYLKAMPAWAD